MTTPAPPEVAVSAPTAWDPRRSLAARLVLQMGLGGALLWAAQAALATRWPGTGGWVLVLGVPALAVAAAATVRQPLRRFAHRLAGREPEDLSPLPLPPEVELQALGEGLNRLLSAQRGARETHRRFLADASHQLRTPLAVLRTQLQSAGGADPRHAEMLRTLDRATAVADELLSRLKLEQRLAARVACQPLRLDTVAEEAALEFAPLIAAKRLEFALDAQPVAAPAEAWMLGELVRNLLANAVRHTPAGAPLTVVVRRAAGCAELIVSDSGSGIAEADRERLFEPFAAASGGTGVGLGLSICRQLAEAMGAEVRLFNRSDGERVLGVDAVVRWLPLAAPPDPP